MIRANPVAAQANSASLAAELDALLARVSATAGGDASVTTLKRVTAAPLIGLLLFYQRFISPMTPADLPLLPVLLVVRPHRHPPLRTRQGNLAGAAAVG